jgi:hypothetical protein
MGFVECLAQAPIPEHLWSQRAPQTRSVDRLNNLFAFARSLERIGGWCRENSAYGVRLNTIQQSVHVLPGDTRARGIMHQDPIIGRGMTRQRGQSITHRMASFAPTSRGSHFGQGHRGYCRKRQARVCKSFIVRPTGSLGCTLCNTGGIDQGRGNIGCARPRRACYIG